EGGDDDRQRPLDLRREVSGPEENQRDQRAGQRRRERHQQDPPVVTQPRFPRLRGGHGQGRRQKAEGRNEGKRQKVEGKLALIVATSCLLPSGLSAAFCLLPSALSALEAVALEPSIESATAETKRLGRLAHV